VKVASIPFPCRRDCSAFSFPDRVLGNFTERAAPVEIPALMLFSPRIFRNSG